MHPYQWLACNIHYLYCRGDRNNLSTNKMAGRDVSFVQPSSTSSSVLYLFTDDYHNLMYYALISKNYNNYFYDCYHSIGISSAIQRLLI